MSYEINPFTGEFDLSKSDWLRKSDSVMASSSKVVDSTPLSSFESRNYFVTIKRISDGEIRTFNLNVIKDGVTVKDSLFGRVGGSLSVAVDTEVNASTYELKITNNNAGSDINIKLLRTKF